MYDYKKRNRKLTTAKDGTLLYPHKFKVGQLMTFKKDYKNINNFLGLGIISEINGNSIVVFWQEAGTYKTYEAIQAVLQFDVIQ